MKQLFLILFLISVCTTFATADLLEGLVLYMPLDEGNGKATEDFSENGLEGELNGGAKWVDGKFGKALEFSASSDFVAIEDDAIFHIEDEITQAAWVNLNRLPSAHAIVFGTRAGGGARHIGFGYGMNPANGIKVWKTVPAAGSWTLTITKPAWIPVNGTTSPIPTHRITKAKLRFTSTAK